MSKFVTPNAEHNIFSSGGSTQLFRKDGNHVLKATWSQMQTTTDLKTKTALFNLTFMDPCIVIENS
jgi:hypothetical protein